VTTKRHILDLSTLVERPTVRIDGVEYTMSVPEDLGLRDLTTVERLRNRVNKVMAKEDVTDADVETVARALETMVRIILPELPGEVLARLSDVKRLAIVNAFRQAVGELMPTPPPPETTASQPTGASSSPA
jgi:hypothetical protein